MSDVLVGYMWARFQLIATTDSIPTSLIVITVAYALFRLSVIHSDLLAPIVRFNERDERLKHFLQDLSNALPGPTVGIRYTLFQPDTIAPQWLVPIARYEHGHDWRASNSRARYLRGMSYTGVAWNLPLGDHGNVIRCVLPHFANRASMDTYYEHTLLIPKRIVKSISEYMITTSVVYGIHLISPAGEDRGVLSIDVHSHCASLWTTHEAPEQLVALADVVSRILMPVLNYERGQL